LADEFRMDKRREDRFEVDQEVSIATLGEHSCRQTARVRNASGSGLGLLVGTEVTPGMAVRIELEDAILLGEAMYCRPLAKGYFVGIQIEQVLRGINELRRRFQSFEDEAESSHCETR
jgi:hypothetical protein